MERTPVQRVQIRLSETNAKRLEELANRYGMSMNSLIAFVLGQWLDNTYDLKDSVRDKLYQVLEGRLDNE